jgi:hypothetical protein
MATKKKAEKAAAGVAKFTYKPFGVKLPNPTLKVPGVEPGYFEPTGAPCRLLSKGQRAAGLRTCPVQLVFVKGTPFLRMCTQANRPGFLMKVTDGAKAYEAAGSACAAAGFAVPKNKKVFTRELLTEAGVEVEETLGGVRRGRGLAGTATSVPAPAYLNRRAKCGCKKGKP